jgi:diguanylate cyclase (GGDEF)-like protein
LESKLSLLAKSDPLTGLATRRTFFELMEREWSRSQRHYIPLSCVMIDIDFFKRINDTYGHRTGDQALRGVAKILQESCRGSDILGRYGGEEFCVLLPETTEDNATQWADRVRERIAENADFIQNLGVNLTASFGVAQRLADTDSPEELVDLADQALLMAKRSGRDRVVSFQTATNSARIQSAAGGPGAMFHDLTAKHVMTTIVAGLNENETVGRAARYFLRFRFNSAPIVNNEGQLAGILSERDVMAIMMWPKWWTTKISDVMKRNVVCYEEDTPVLLIYEFLCRVSIRGVIVVKGGQPTGMISRGSLLRWFTNLLAVNPSSMVEDPMLDLRDQKESAPATEPRQNVAMIVKALANEVEELEQRIRREQHDLVPAVVGGVSRLEELINDLLAFSRFANAWEDEARAEGLPAASPVVGNLCDVVSQLQPEGDFPATTSAAWFPPGCEPEIPSEPPPQQG